VKKRKISTTDFATNPVLKERSGKSKAVARALDKKAHALPFARVFNSFEFEDFLTQLTPKRFELLRIASKGRHSIADLASASQRNPSAVSRDIAKLSALGLVKVESVSNQGHGQKKVVLPVANTISINASIAAL
jgi:predicted transcriptional regulator